MSIIFFEIEKILTSSEFKRHFVRGRNVIMTFYDKNSIFTKTNQHCYKIIKRHFISCSPLCLIQRSEVLESTDHGFESQKNIFFLLKWTPLHDWWYCMNVKTISFFLNYFFYLSLHFSLFCSFLCTLFGKIIRYCIISRLHQLTIENEGASCSVSCRIAREYCYSLTYTWSR